MDTPENMKNTPLAPSTSGLRRIGQTRLRINTVPHKVRRQIPRATSIVVSAAYNQATGPLVF